MRSQPDTRTPRTCGAGRGVAAVVVLGLLPSGTAGQTQPTHTLRQADARVSQGFTQITSVRELADGRLLISDRVENSVAVVDWSTGAAAPVGRVGDGPGEYRAAGWLYAIASDSSILTDWQTRRWYLLDATTIVETIPPNEQIRGFDPILGGASDDGKILGTVGSVFSSRSRMSDSADSLLILLGDRSSARVDTVAEVVGRGAPTTTRTARGARIAHNPLAAQDLALLFPDGAIAIAHLDPYRVDWRSSDGSWVRGSPLPFDRIPVTRSERCAALQRRFGVLPQDCDQGSVPNWPDAIPPFLPIASTTMSAPASSTLFAAPDGRLVIRRTPTASSPSNRYDVVDRTGALTMVLTLPANEAIIGFGDHSVYVVSTDHDDLQWLRRHPWP